MEEYGGCLPASAENLMKLPGIGSYTAGAIASIAFGIPVPAVDGNVLRVLSRLLASRQDIRKGTVKTWMERLLKGVIPARNPGDFNQALIEIGAIVCLPSGEPKCGECPLESLCLARRRGLLKEIPVRSPLKSRRREELTVFLIRRGDQVAIRRRPDQGLLASLYELPNLSGWQEADRALEAYRYSGKPGGSCGAAAGSKAYFFSCGMAYEGISYPAETGWRKERETGRGLLFCRETADSHILRPAWSFCRLLCFDLRMDKPAKRGYTGKEE